MRTLTAVVVVALLGTLHTTARADLPGACPFVPCPDEALACSCDGAEQVIEVGSRRALDRRERVRWDETQRVLTLDTDLDADGAVNMSTVTTYDEAGAIVDVRRDEMDQWGNVIASVHGPTLDSPVERFTYRNTRTGRRIHTERWQYEGGRPVLHEVDNGSDGSIDFRQVITYDANGYLQGHTNDYGGDGNIDEVRTYEVDSRGFVQSYTEDTNMDGAVDVVRRYVYHEWDAILEHLEDRNNDGEDDVRCTYRPPCGAGYNPNLCRTLGFSNIDCEPLTPLGND